MLPANWFDRADALGIVISSLLFRIHFFPPISSWFTVCSHPPPCFLPFSSFLSHPLKEADARFFPSFFMCMLLLSCAHHLLAERLNCCHCFSNSDSVFIPSFCAPLFVLDVSLKFFLRWNTGNSHQKAYLHITLFLSPLKQLFFLEVLRILSSPKYTTPLTLSSPQITLKITTTASRDMNLWSLNSILTRLTANNYWWWTCPPGALVFSPWLGKHPTPIFALGANILPCSAHR